MSNTTWRPRILRRANQLAAIVFVGASVVAFRGDTAMAQSNQPQQQVIIVDDNPLQTCFNPPCSFELYNDPIVQGYPFKDSRTTDTTYGGHAYWASTQPSRGFIYIDGGAKWRPFVEASTQPGQYRVAAFIPRVATGMADTRCATYSVQHANGESLVQVDQGASAGGWFTLGTFWFTGSPSELVDLNWNVDNVTCDGGSSSILFDAMRFEPAGESPQPISVRAFLRDLPEGATVASGTTIWHCFSISRAAPIRWWWYKERTGWTLIDEWEDDGQGACTESDPLEEAGIRKTKIQALSNGTVAAEHETHFYVGSAVPPTSTPRPVPTAPTEPTVTPTPARSVQVWIESGCGRTYSIGQPIRVGVQADAPGIARLSFQPQGVEFAVRSLQANSPELVDTVVDGPLGAQSVLAQLLVGNRLVASASCDLRVGAPQTATPRRPGSVATPGAVHAFLPYSSRSSILRLPTPTQAAVTSRPPATSTANATARAPIIDAANVSALSVRWEDTGMLQWVETLDISPGSTVLAVGGGGGGGVRVYRSEGGEPTCAIDVGKIVHSVEVFDDGAVYMGTAEGHVFAWDWIACRQRWHKEGAGNDLAVNDEQTQLASGGQIWRILGDGLELIHELGPGVARPGAYVSGIHSGGGRLGLYGNGIHVFSEQGERIMQEALPTDPGFISFVSWRSVFYHASPVSFVHQLATSDSGGETYVWTFDADQLGAVERVMTSQDSGHTSGATQSFWGDVVATAFHDGRVTLREVPAEGNLLRVIRQSAGAVRAAQFSPDGRFLAVGDDSEHGEGRVTVYSVAGE